MQIDVTMGILFTILNKRIVTREYLAQKYEISPRTVTRCIAALCAAGLPILSKNGTRGGITVSDDFRMDAAFFTQNELKYLIDYLRQDKNSALALSLLDKLENLARLKKHDESVSVKSSNIVIESGNFSATESLREKMSVLTRAAEMNHCVSFKYIDRYDSQTVRRVDPYQLVLRDQIWYLYGYCQLRQAFRLFKLSRIKNLKKSETRFVPSGGNVFETLEAMYDAPLIDVEFEFSVSALERVEEWLGFEAVTEHGLSYRARATVSGGAETLNKLLSFGSSITLLSPAELKSKLIKETRLMSEKYSL